MDYALVTPVGYTQAQYVLCITNGEGKGLDTCYSAAYMNQPRDQQRFTSSEVAADWHGRRQAWARGETCRPLENVLSYIRFIYNI